jgi:hypothetical protein
VDAPATALYFSSTVLMILDHLSTEPLNKSDIHCMTVVATCVINALYHITASDMMTPQPTLYSQHVVVVNGRTTQPSSKQWAKFRLGRSGAATEEWSNLSPTPRSARVTACHRAATERMGEGKLVVGVLPGYITSSKVGREYLFAETLPNRTAIIRGDLDGHTTTTMGVDSKIISCYAKCNRHLLARQS